MQTVCPRDFIFPIPLILNGRVKPVFHSVMMSVRENFQPAGSGAVPGIMFKIAFCSERFLVILGTDVSKGLTSR